MINTPATRWHPLQKATAGRSGSDAFIQETEWLTRLQLWPKVGTLVD
jgi:hypothetical protein